jgi:hypothetical protein
MPTKLLLPVWWLTSDDYLFGFLIVLCRGCFVPRNDVMVIAASKIPNPKSKIRNSKSSQNLL